MRMPWLTKTELLILVIIFTLLTPLFVYILNRIPISLADPKPKLPPQEQHRIYHPEGFSIIAPKGWSAIVETTQKEGFNRITIQPDIDARWSPKLSVRSHSKDENPYAPLDPNNYKPEKYLEHDAMVYEGLCADYHGWLAVFTHQGKYYRVLLMLPHGHGPPRYDKVPEYWWPFLDSLRFIQE